MTRKEIFTALLDGTLDHDTLVEFCTKELASLDHKADKAKERAAAKREAGDELQTVVQAALTADFASREDITAKVQETVADATVGKVGYRLTQLIKAGIAQKAEATADDADGKKKRITVYALA